MALCLTNNLGNWPVGAHAIRFTTGVDKHQSVCMLSGASFINTDISAVLIVNHASNGRESHLYTWLCCKFCVRNAQGTRVAIATFSLLVLISIS